MQILKELKQPGFASADSKEVAGAFFASADSKGDSGLGAGLTAEARRTQTRAAWKAPWECLAGRNEVNIEYYTTGVNSPRRLDWSDYESSSTYQDD